MSLYQNMLKSFSRTRKYQKNMINNLIYKNNKIPIKYKISLNLNMIFPKIYSKKVLSLLNKMNKNLCLNSFLKNKMLMIYLRKTKAL